jgi:predicted  nucleic acid-binding Zn-ribbon protein
LQQTEKTAAAEKQRLEGELSSAKAAAAKASAKASEEQAGLSKQLGDSRAAEEVLQAQLKGEQNKVADLEQVKAALEAQVRRHFDSRGERLMERSRVGS